MGDFYLGEHVFKYCENVWFVWGDGTLGVRGDSTGVSSVMMTSRHPAASTTLNLITPHRVCAQTIMALPIWSGMLVWGWRDGSMAQGPAPTRQLTAMWNLSSKGASILFWSPWQLSASGTVTYLQALTQTQETNQIKGSKALTNFLSAYRRDFWPPQLWVPPPPVRTLTHYPIQPLPISFWCFHNLTPTFASQIGEIWISSSSPLLCIFKARHCLYNPTEQMPLCEHSGSLHPSEWTTLLKKIMVSITYSEQSMLWHGTVRREGPASYPMALPNPL